MKFIPDTDEKYSITKSGRIYSHLKNIYLKATKNNRGYHCVILHCAKNKSRLVHRLVAETYLGKSDLTVNHIDGDKDNNKLSNLEYMTYKQNENHAYSIGLKTKIDRELVRPLFNTDLSYNEIALEIGCSRRQIKRIASELFDIKYLRNRQHRIARIKHYRKPINVK